MAITDSGIYSDSTKLPPCSCPKKKNKNICYRPKDEGTGLKSSGSQNASLQLHIHEMGPICTARTQSAATFSESEEEDEYGDFLKQFSKEGCPDDDSCVWLSGGLSPSSCLDDYELFSLLDFPLDAWFISLLSISANSLPISGKAHTFFDGSRVNPIEEASLVLGQKLQDDQMISQDNSKEEEVFTWLVTSTGSESTDSCVTCFESAGSSCGQPFKEYYSCDNSSQFSPILASPSKLYIANTLSEMKYFQSGFFSPSSQGCCSSESQASDSSDSSVIESIKDESSTYSPSSGSDYASEVFDLEDFGNDRALFWPSDWKPDWGSEAKWELFIMSPRKNVGIPERTSPESIRLRVHKGTMDLEKGCKRRLLFGPGSKSSNLFELKCISGSKETRRVNTMPSRLRKFSKNCMKIVPLDLEDEPAEAVISEKPTIKPKQLWEEDFESNEDLPIETMLGLDEFDGHEGVDSEFNKDDFSLDEPL